MHGWATSPAKLLGRAGALSTAEAGMERAGGVMLVGPPGVGKTALARTLLERRAESEGDHVMWLVADAAGASVPFGAFAPLVPEVGGLPGAQADPFYLLQSLRRAVVGSAGGRPLILGVDDAHRLDEASATLVFQLVSTSSAKAVVTSRTGESVPGPLRSLWKEGLVERIDLGPLERDDARELASSLLGGPLDGDLDEALWEAGGGNPLYVRELLVAGTDSGRVVMEDGIWRLHGGLTIGPRLSELLDERFAKVDAELVPSLEVVAFAEPLPLGVLGRIIPAGHSDALQRAGMVVVEPSGSGGQLVRTFHPLYGEAIRERLPANRSTELALQLADAFEADGRLPSDLLRVVTWRLGAGVRPPAPTLTAASQQAAGRLDWELSRRLAEAAVDAGAGPAGSLALADALAHLGRHSEALAALGDYSGASEEEAARVAVLRSTILFWGMGRSDEAEAALAGARSSLVGEQERAWIESVRAGMLNYMGDPTGAVAAARPLLSLPGISPKTEVAARFALSMGLAWSGRCDEALAVVESWSDPEIDPAGTPSLSMRWNAVARMTAYRLSGRLQDMEDLAAEEYSLALQLHDRDAKGAAAGILGWVALARGQITLAITRFREAVSSIVGADPTAARRQFLAGLVEALALSGDVRGATGALSEARAEMQSSEQWFGPRLLISAAWVTAARGESSRALQELEEAAELAGRTGQVAFELLALGVQLRLGSTAGLARIEELAGWVEGPLVQIMAHHAQALAEDSADGLDTVAERYSVLGLRLNAAEVAARASQVHQRSGLPRRAAASAARAQGLLVDFESSPPLTVVLASAPASLTRREREVAMLARSGLSSQAIASRLHLSVRTVDTHLARVYYKLGISRRSELIQVLRYEPDSGDPAGAAPA